MAPPVRSGSIEPSPVLLAMGRSHDEARSCVRFSLGRGNDESQVLALAEAVVSSAKQMRGTQSQKGGRVCRCLNRISRLPHLPRKTPGLIAVAMSGGVDSSVVAGLMARQGSTIGGADHAVVESAPTARTG